MLAAWWLADGHDSELLRELAGLSAAETTAARELMPEALRSVGCPVLLESEFAEQCRVPLDIVNRDLEASGYGRYRMHPVNLLRQPISLEMWAAVPDGRSWSRGGPGMTPEMNDTDLLWHAARSVSDTLGEVLGITWPVCPAHDSGPMTPPGHREVPGGLIDGTVWWWCRRKAGHGAAPVGMLTPMTPEAG